MHEINIETIQGETLKIIKETQKLLTLLKSSRATCKFNNPR